MQKWSLAFLLVMCVCLPFSHSYAANSGKWDYKGTQTFKWFSNAVKSGGGDFKICLKSGPSCKYTLKKADGFNNASDIVGTRCLSKGKCTNFKNVNKYVDDGQAEFFVQKDANTGKETMSFWD
ncbi:hypothetical protein [Shimazuella alba]|uniref:Uncharacterized protein n=1 Tax=Shimazuella alba TaxID=2690964 RepID=A0A6I4VPE3_9BACL|nr:hypothetical protein [Shimazuella alba]MXQ53409.1 hypothetical protein [Shimazuella alba]